MVSFNLKRVSFQLVRCNLLNLDPFVYITVSISSIKGKLKRFDISVEIFSFVIKIDTGYSFDTKTID